MSEVTTVASFSPRLVNDEKIHSQTIRPMPKLKNGQRWRDCKRLHSSPIQWFVILIAPIARSHGNHEHKDRLKVSFQRLFEWNLSDILQERRILPDWILNVQQHKRSPMPQAQSLKLSSKATVQHTGVVLGQVRVLEGLENLIERPARNTRNAKARWSHWELRVHTESFVKTQVKGKKNLDHYHCGHFTSEANNLAHIDHVTVIQRLDIQRINRKYYKKTYWGLHWIILSTLNNLEQMSKKKKTLKLTQIYEK